MCVLAETALANPGLLFHQVLELDPGSAWARGAISRLEPLVQEKNEKLKNEMFGKLKVRSV